MSLDPRYVSSRSSNDPQDVPQHKQLHQLTSDTTGLVAIKRKSQHSLQVNSSPKKYHPTSLSPLLQTICLMSLDHSCSDSTTRFSTPHDILSPYGSATPCMNPPTNIITPVPISKTLPKPHNSTKRKGNTKKKPRHLHLRVVDYLKQATLEASMIKEGVELNVCCLCESGEFSPTNLIIFCNGACGNGYHQKCYQSSSMIGGDGLIREAWKCHEADCLNLRSTEGHSKWREKSKRFTITKRKGAFSDHIQMSVIDKDRKAFWESMDCYFDKTQLYLSLPCLLPSSSKPSKALAPLPHTSSPYELQWLNEESIILNQPIHVISPDIYSSIFEHSPSISSSTKSIRVSLLYRVSTTSSHSPPSNPSTLTLRMINNNYALALHLITSSDTRSLQGSPFSYTFPPQPYSSILGRFTNSYSKDMDTDDTVSIECVEQASIIDQEEQDCSQSDEISSEIWLLEQELAQQVSINNERKAKLSKLVKDDVIRPTSLSKTQREYWNLLDELHLYLSREYPYKFSSLFYNAYKMNHPFSFVSPTKSNSKYPLIGNGQFDTFVHALVHECIQSSTSTPVDNSEKDDCIPLPLGLEILNHPSQSSSMFKDISSYLENRIKYDYTFHQERIASLPPPENTPPVPPAPPPAPSTNSNIVCSCSFPRPDLNSSIICSSCSIIYHFPCTPSCTNQHSHYTVSQYTCASCTGTGSDHVQYIDTFDIDPQGVIDNGKDCDVYDYASNRVFLRPRHLYIKWRKKRKFIKPCGFRLQRIDGPIRNHLGEEDDDRILDSDGIIGAS